MSGSAPGTLVPHEDVHSVNTYRAHATLLTALTTSLSTKWKLERTLDSGGRSHEEIRLIHRARQLEPEHRGVEVRRFFGTQRSREDDHSEALHRPDQGYLGASPCKRRKRAHPEKEGTRVGWHPD